MRLSTILVVLGGLCIAQPSFAGDSTWLVCKGIAKHGAGKLHLVVSALDHRAASGDQRDLSITILHGAHESRGVVKNVTTGKPSALIAKTKARTTIDARLTLDPGMTSLTLDGTIDPAFGVDAKPKRVAFTAKLACETLDDLAIGH